MTKAAAFCTRCLQAEAHCICDSVDVDEDYMASVMAGLNGQAPEQATEQAAEDPDDLAARIAWEHRKAVEAHKGYLRVRQEAEAELLSEGSKPAPEPVRLDALLAEPDEPVAYRVDRLWPADGRVILAAQRKAGKTTCMANLLRSLVDGSPFLGCYQVTPVPAGKTVFAIDTEMSRRMLRTWYTDQRIDHPERIHIEPLRGAVGSFNILDAGRRAWWAAVIRDRQAAVLVLDCIGPILAAAGLDESSSLDVGRFLAAFEELLAEAGVTEAAAAHHMGHVAERSRGASRLRDWPDAEWKLVYEIAVGDDDAGPGARRYFSAAGRDVAEHEQLLDYDAASLRLTIAGGTRRDEKKAAYLAAIIDYITSHPEAECSKTRVEEAVEGRAADIRKVLTEAVSEGGPLCVHDGKRGARLHRIRADCPEHSATPSHPVQGVLEVLALTPSHPYRGDVVKDGAPGHDPDQEHRDEVKSSNPVSGGEEISAESMRHNKVHVALADGGLGPAKDYYDLRGTPIGDKAQVWKFDRMVLATPRSKRRTRQHVEVFYCAEGWHSKSGSQARPSGPDLCSTLLHDKWNSGDDDLGDDWRARFRAFHDQHPVLWIVKVRMNSSTTRSAYCDPELPDEFRPAADQAGTP